MPNIMIGTTALAGIALAVPADAVTVFEATLSPLSGSGVSGDARLVHDPLAQTLKVQINASGLVPGMVHPQHIHGAFNDAGMPIESTTPTLAQDDDGDGFIELAEGLETYGPVIVSLTSPPGGALSGFPTAPDGTINFSETYDLTDPTTFDNGFDVSDLLPLHLREIVLHGDFDPPGVGDGTPGEIDGMDGYEPVFPVAAGEINVIPLPAAGWMLLSALAGFGLLGRSSMRSRKA